MPKKAICIIGLGPGDPALIPERSVREVEIADVVFVRTERHGAVSFLREKAKNLVPLDEIYNRAGSYDQLYDRIAEAVLKEARSGKHVVYAVPGDASLGEEATGRIVRKAAEVGIHVEIIPGISFIDAIFAEVGINPLSDGLQVIDAISFDGYEWSPKRWTLFYQVYSRLVAGKLKGLLYRFFSDSDKIFYVKNASTGNPTVKEISLAEMDRQDYDHMVSILVPPSPNARTFDELLRIMETLREKCPWDSKQTHKSLTPYLIEEAYEVLESIDRGDIKDLEKELGDLLLQVIFHSQIAKEEGLFTADDVVRGLAEKLYKRHPHVFGNVKVSSAADVSRNWEAIKEKEEKRKSLMDGIPTSMPALSVAFRVQEKAASVGFDWERAEDVLEKIREEVEEIRAANGKALEEEVGDLLFSVVNFARKAGIDPEAALRKANAKFIERFRKMEEMARGMGKSLRDFDLEGLDKLWEKAKGGERR